MDTYKGTSDCTWGGGGQRNRLLFQKYGLIYEFLICSIPVATTVDVMVSLRCPTLSLPLLVDHIGPGLCTIKSTLEATGMDKFRKAEVNRTPELVTVLVVPPFKICYLSFNVEYLQVKIILLIC